MRRRSFIGGLTVTATLAPLHAVFARDDAEEAVEFVRTVYRQQADAHNNRTRNPEFLSLFTEEVAELYRAPPRPDVPEGPTLNIFFGGGVLPPHPVTFEGIIGVAGEREPFIVKVAVTVRGARHRFDVYVVRQSGRWRISNIVYDAGRDFVSFLRWLSGR